MDDVKRSRRSRGNMDGFTSSGVTFVLPPKILEPSKMRRTCIVLQCIKLFCVNFNAQRLIIKLRKAPNWKR